MLFNQEKQEIQAEGVVMEIFKELYEVMAGSELANAQMELGKVKTISQELVDSLLLIRDQESFNNTNFIKFGAFEILQNKKGETPKINN